MPDIKLPEAKPAFEWINGRAVQKVSPKRKHGLAQFRFAAALEEWSLKRNAGTVATEWRFLVQPPGEVRRPLVPDVAFLSYKRLPLQEQEAIEEPLVAPNVVVEVLSPDDRHGDVQEKVRVYLAAGAHVLFLVDTETQTVTICDDQGTRKIPKGGILEHQGLEGFRLPIERLFTPIPSK